MRQNRMHLNMDFCSRSTSELIFALMLKAKKVIDLGINGSQRLLCQHSLKFKEIRHWEIRPPAKNCKQHSCVLTANIILPMQCTISQKQTITILVTVHCVEGKQKAGSYIPFCHQFKWLTFTVYSRQSTSNVRWKTYQPVLTENCWEL